MTNDNTLHIYTDGACKGNPGIGGWGALLCYGAHQKILNGAEAMTTNNRMELTAAIEALRAVKRACPSCNGSGQIRIQQGFFSIAQPCPQCGGKGQIIENPCTDCHGDGRVKQQKTLNVNIPAGVDTGDRIRLAGEGEAGERGAAAGDLYVEIRVRKHPIFTRTGDDLHCEMPISFVTAALGGDLEVPTLGGRVVLNVPPETQTGKRFRLKGKGVKSVRSRAAGDLYCTVNIETPVKLSKKQKDLLAEFGSTLSEGGNTHAPQEKSFLDKVKKFFDNL